ncbi:Hypothetical predicted protein [Podarcis lilfordi]|uniref:Uncharacterized protein n=1 Tax=Podarcis lilfordi TaxID=74358 RepID=A0AA35JQ66_9SAUR|nr:Hypothetical predicted protein [Podarcis lilfordi]
MHHNFVRPHSCGCPSAVSEWSSCTFKSISEKKDYFCSVRFCKCLFSIPLQCCDGLLSHNYDLQLGLPYFVCVCSTGIMVVIMISATISGKS